MRRDKTKSVLSIIATLVSILLVLIYWLAPAGETSHRLYKLFIDCIPDSLVVLITIPVVYWLLYTRGLTNMGDCPLFTGHSHADLGGRRSHHSRRSADSTPAQPPKTAADDYILSGERDVLIVVPAPDGIAQSSDADTLLTAINATVRIAESKGILVVFTKCYLPPGNSSRGHGRPSKHTRGGKTPRGGLLHDLYKPAGSVVLDLCTRSQTSACSAVPDSVLDMVISNPRVRTVYVAGFALESCVQAICRMGLQQGKRTVALANAIGQEKDKAEQAERIWTDLTAEGLVRQECLQ